MVDSELKCNEIPVYINSASGAASGVITRAVAQPLDVLKIRFQIQVEPLNGQIQYNGYWHACSKIYAKEGLRAFWKGHVPAQYLSVVYGLSQFGLFELLTRKLSPLMPARYSAELRPVTHFMCGSVAGCVATLCSMPFDVIRTRFVAQGEPKVYRSLAHATRCIWTEEGARAYFRGLAPTLVQIAPQTGFQFGFYTFYKSIWQLFVEHDTQSKDNNSGTNMKSLVCGSAAGLCAKTLVYPLDLTKKRLQVQGFEKGWASSGGHTRHYSGLLHCIETVLREEGMRGLFRGLSPSLVKAVVTTGISFWGYEQSLRIFTRLYLANS